jgi:hypothetical protein
MDLNTEDCTSCHSAGEVAPVFSEIHTGYDKAIYTADGLKYSEIISVKIDSASFDGNKLNIKFSAAEFQDLDGVNVATITPTVLSLYGYGIRTRSLAHERLDDTRWRSTATTKEP